MATDQQFCLRWNNHQSTLISVFDSLLENGTLVDCTLAAEGQYLKAHKVVLSACSPYLETLLSQHYEKHPIVILKDVKFTELKSMMDYMYRGEVNISQDQLGTFLKAAESLQIKGLSENGDDARDVGSTKRQETPSSRPSVTQVRTTESKRPAPPGDISDASRDGSISPSSLRKRRRTRRPSQGDDPDSHLDTTSNTCDLPVQAQSTPLSVPSSVVPTPVQNLPKQIVKQEPPSRLDHSPIAPESGLLKEKIEPPSEPLLEPKTEYLDYMNNENSIEVEDLTLDDDEEDLDSSMDTSRPGPSHGDMSNQGYQWPMSGDQSGTDEIFMAAQQAVGAATGQQRDSQGDLLFDEDCKSEVDLKGWMAGEDEQKPIFVSAPCGAGGSTELFFSELNNPPTKQVFNNSLEKGLFLGRETESINNDYSVSDEHNYNSAKHKIRSHLSRSVLGVKRGVKVTHSPMKVGTLPDLAKTSNREKYLSSRGRRRKLLTWSGESFIKDEKGELAKSKVTEDTMDESECEANEPDKVSQPYKSDADSSFEVTNRSMKRMRTSFKCTKCGLTYKFLKGLKTHQRYCKHQSEKQPINDIKRIFKKQQPQRYDFAIKPYGFECRKCGLQYRYLRGLRTHQRLVCDREPRFSCPFCPLKTHTRQSLRKHAVRRHLDLI